MLDCLHNKLGCSVEIDVGIDITTSLTAAWYVPSIPSEITINHKEYVKNLFCINIK